MVLAWWSMLSVWICCVPFAGISAVWMTKENVRVITRCRWKRKTIIKAKQSDIQITIKI